MPLCAGGWFGPKTQKVNRGMILEKGMKGFTAPPTHGKWFRASATGELVFDRVKVPKENILPNVKGPKVRAELSDQGKVWHSLGSHWLQWIAMIRPSDIARKGSI